MAISTLNLDYPRMKTVWSKPGVVSIKRPFPKLPNSSLFDSTGQLTSLGLAYADLVPQHAPEPGSILILIFGQGSVLLIEKNTEHFLLFYLFVGKTSSEWVLYLVSFIRIIFIRRSKEY